MTMLINLLKPTHRGDDKIWIPITAKIILSLWTWVFGFWFEKREPELRAV